MSSRGPSLSYPKSPPSPAGRCSWLSAPPHSTHARIRHPKHRQRYTLALRRSFGGMADPQPADPPLNGVESSGEAGTESPSTNDRDLQETDKIVSPTEASEIDTPKTTMSDKAQSHGLENGHEKTAQKKAAMRMTQKKTPRTIHERLRKDWPRWRLKPS